MGLTRCPVDRWTPGVGGGGGCLVGLSRKEGETKVGGALSPNLLYAKPQLTADANNGSNNSLHRCALLTSERTSEDSALRTRL